MSKKRPGAIAIIGSVIATAAAGFLGYASVLDPSDGLVGFRRHLYDSRAWLALAVGVFALVARLKHYWDQYFAERHKFKPALERLVNGYSHVQFPGRERQNRVTLFKRTSGATLKLRGFTELWRLLTEPGRAKYLWGLDWRSDYLAVYVRAKGARNRRSPIAWRVSDDPEGCHGVAGMIWDEAGMVDLTLDAVPDVKQVATIRSIGALPPDDQTRKYLEGSNVRSIASVRSMKNFGRHFCGTIIRAGGHPWGVLLIDSTEDVCCFGPDSVPRDELGRLAVTIGQVLGEPTE